MIKLTKIIREKEWSLRESKVIHSQAIDDDIHFAVITSDPEHGYGVFSWHTDEFSARYNAKATGGYVVKVEQDKYGQAEVPKSDVNHALSLSGLDFHNDPDEPLPTKPKLRIVKESLVEMVMPREIDQSVIYYHGTPSKDSALKIMKSGLAPQDIEFLNKKYVTSDEEVDKEIDRHYMPIVGRVYLTQDLFSAISYAKSNLPWEDGMKSNEHGYVVKVIGQELKDIEPDEDNVGSIVLDIGNYVKSPRQYPLRFKIRTKYIIELFKIAKQHLGEKYWEKSFDEPQAGKIILPHLSDELKLAIIDIGKNIAHVGTISASELWEFNVSDYFKLFSDDGKTKNATIDEFINNFFTKYARRIK
jgi:hypothetical protein